MRTHTFFAFVVAVVVAIWIGASVVMDGIVMPTAFGVLTRGAAGDLGRAVFPKLNYLECGLGAVAILAAFALGRPGWGTRRRHFLGVALTVLMTVIALTYLFGLTPAILAEGDAMRTTGEEGARMALLHSLYGGLELLKLAAGLSVHWLLASRRPA